MQLLKFKFPAYLLRNESHEEEEAIIRALFGQIEEERTDEEERAWIGKVATCLSGYLGLRSTLLQTAMVLHEGLSSTEVLIGGTESVRTVRIEHRNASWQSLRMTLSVENESDFASIEIGSRFLERTDAVCEVLLGFGAELTSVKEMTGRAVNLRKFEKDLELRKLERGKDLGKPQEVS